MKFRQSLFWDVDSKKINPKRHARYIVERILDFGNDKEVRWIWQNYSYPFLKQVVNRSRVLRPETKKLWSLLLQKKK